MTPEDKNKIDQIQELIHKVPTEYGQNFILVYLNLTWMPTGHINFGINHKMEMGEIEFKSLDQAIEEINKLLARMKTDG